MAFFHSKTKAKKTAAYATEIIPEDAHRNFMNGVSWDITDPLVALRVAAASCFFGEPMYYQRDSKVRVPAGAQSLAPHERRDLRNSLNAMDSRGKRERAPATLIEDAIDLALMHDAEATLALAVTLRTEDHVRTTPQVILVRAANSPHARGTGLIRKYAPAILQRADEPAVALSYQLARYGRPIPNSLKRALAARLQRARPYELAKYREEGKAAKTVDVVRLTHAKGQSIDKLVKNELTNDGATWEAIISKDGSNQSSWTRAAAVMGHMALLRNLRNFKKHDVELSAYVPRLISTAAESQVLPFRYASAYFALKEAGAVKGDLTHALEVCISLSLGAMPRLPGRVVALADNSGSAQGTLTSSLGTMKVSTIGNLSGVLASRLGDSGALGVFGDKLESFEIERRAPVFESLDRAERLARSIGQATENGVWLFFERALREREHVDHLFVFSDMQAGHGGLYGVDPREYARFQTRGRYIDVASLVREYRRVVNPRVMVYLVQIAGYSDTLVPETTDRTFILGGFSEGLLRYAARMSNLARG
jgi:hypothetical protein